MSKIRISKELAKAIETTWGVINRAFGVSESQRFIAMTDWNLVRSCSSEQTFSTLFTYAKSNFVDYARILTEGYEIEKTPTENLRDYIELLRSREGNHLDDLKGIELRGVMNTLYILGLDAEYLVKDRKEFTLNA